jgi:hypothetical protein
MSRNDHIALVTLFERARLKREFDSATQSHLGSCEICRGRLSWIEVAADLGAQELLYDPPESVMENVLRLGRNTSRLKQLRNVIVALLTFDSFNDPAPVGVRHSEATSRQMTFEGDGVEIAIWLQRSEDRSLTVSGQVLDKSSGPIQDPSAHVDLVVQGDHMKASTLSPWGEFVFNDVPKTRYALQVHFLGRVLEIPSLPLFDEEGS